MFKSPLLLAAAGLLLAAAAALAQPGTNAATQPTEVEPIQCWWRTSASAVRVGDTFALVLTCAVIETVSTTVVPDESRLDPSVLQLAPFEVTGGSHAADLRTTARRFFQYEYTLRYLGEDFGKDVPLPALAIAYRVQTKVNADAAAIETRDRNYTLPSHQVRILSLVPFAARDIRDRAPDTFRAIEARQFRGRVLDVAGLGLLGLGGILLVWAAIRVISRRDRKVVTAVALATDGAVLAAVTAELDEVARARQVSGWSDALARRALGPLRIAAAYAVGGQPSQAPLTRGAASDDGRLIVRSRLRPGRTAVVSGSTTAWTVAQERVRREGLGDGANAVLSEVESALAAFDAAAYSREFGTGELDEALACAQRAAAAVRRHHGPVARAVRALRQSLPGAGRAAWAR